MKRRFLYKILILVFALVSSLASIGVANKTYAAPEDCYANTAARLAQQVKDASGMNSLTITLCTDISGDVNLKPRHIRNLTLNMGDYVINGDFIVHNNLNVTINASSNGGINGTINARSNHLTITGGTYTPSSPINYVKDEGLSAYEISSNVWRVEPKLTENNVTVTPESIVIRKGDTATVTAGKPTGSTTGFAFGATDSSVASINENGVVTGVAVGNSTVTVTPTYDSNIVKVVSVKVLPKLTAVNAANVTVRAGKTNTITTPTVEDTSITGATFTYVSGDESIATVDADGVVTGVSNGVANITVTATYTDELGTQTVSTTITASVFDIQAGEKDDSEVAADTARDIVDQGLPEDMADASDEIKEAFGSDYETTGNNLKDAMNRGSVITTSVNVNKSTDDHAKARIDEALAGVNVTSISYYDVTVSLEQGIGLLHKLKSKLTVALATYEEPAAGFTREYYVVAYHEGDDFAQILTRGVDWDVVDGEIVIMSDRFSTFAVAYEDTPIPEPTPEEESTETPAAKSPNTGVYTKTQTSVSSSLSVLTSVVVLMSLVGLVGVVKVANRK